MTPKFKTYDLDLSIKTIRPSLPRAYTKPQTNTDPSAYYTKALGFLPIDTRYLNNTTNQLAYNSVADVLFNKAAWDKRWANSDASWLSEWWAYIPRTVVDLGLLFKEKTFDPIAQGIAEDGWNGFTRGASTALMNGLVDLGNSLDIVSNPIKGLILEGGEGFKKGLFGDEDGRKQYDYMNYVDTGSGFVDFISSLALEIVSDPLNLISFGTKGAVSAGAKGITSGLKSTIKTSLKESIDSIVKTAAKATVDDLVEPLMKSAKFLSEDTARAVLKEMTDESGEFVTKAGVDRVVDSATDVLTEGLKRLPAEKLTKENIVKLSEGLAQSKKARYKAGLLSKGAELTPAAQRYASDYLRYAADNIPDILSINKTYNAGVKILRGVRNFEKGLGYVAGAGGLDYLVAGDKAAKYIGGKINNARALRNLPHIQKAFENISNTAPTKAEFVDAFKQTLHTMDATELDEHITLFKEIEDIMDTYTTTLWSGARSNKIISAQQKALVQVQDVLKKLQTTHPDINTLEDYVKFFKDLDSVSDMSRFVKYLESVNKTLTADVTNKAIRSYHIAAANSFKRLLHEQLTGGQQASMSAGDDLLKEWRRTQLEGSKLAKELSENASQYDEAIEHITDPAHLHQLESVIVPSAHKYLGDNRTGVRADIFLNRVSVSDDTLLDELYNSFKEALKAYDADPTDYSLKKNLVYKYDELIEHLQKNAQFPEYNINTIGEAVNKYGAHKVARTKSTIEYEGFIHPLEQEVETVQLVIQKDFYLKELLKEYETVSSFDAPAIVDKISRHLLKEYGPLGELAYFSGDLSEVYTIFSYYDVAFTKENLLYWASLRKIIMSSEPLVQQKQLYNFYKSSEGVAATPKEILQGGVQRIEKTVKKELSNFDTRLAWEAFKMSYDSTPSLSISKLASAATDDLSPEALTGLITGLSRFNIKDISATIDPTDYIKYKLVTYNIQLSKTSFYNGMLGLDYKGKLISNDATNAPMLHLLLEYKDPNSALYYILNNTSDYPEYVVSQSIKPMRDLLERLNDYVSLNKKLHDLLNTSGLGDMFHQAYSDQLISILTRNKYITLNNISEVVENMIDGADIFIRTRLGTESNAMDAVLRRSVDAVLNNSNASAQAQRIARRIQTRLMSGSAHESVTDVNNWIDLLYLANATGDPTLEGFKKTLIASADGKYIIVFDMETIGAAERSTVPYQISGKVLDAEGKVVKGSEFNYVIKPPEGYAPDTSVLRDLAVGRETDPQLWWNENIINNPNAITLDEAINSFYEMCSSYRDGVILAGQNINRFDVKLLIKHSVGDANKFFNTVSTFDSLEYFNIRNVFQLQGEQRVQFKFKLEQLFREALSSDNKALTHSLFTYDDINTLHEFKTFVAEEKLLSDGFTKTDTMRFSNQIDMSGSSPAALGYRLHHSDGFGIEDAIDSITHLWRSPTKFRGQKYFTVSKLNAYSFEETVQKYFKELAAKGLLDVAPGQNIMDYFIRNVASDHIVINPRKSMSYEVEDVFDIKKALSKFGVAGDETKLAIYDMEKMTRQMYRIKDKRVGLTAELIDLLEVDARAFLKELSEFKDLPQSFKYCSVLQQHLDVRTTVATAEYYYKLLPAEHVLRSNESYRLLGNRYEAVKTARAVQKDVDYTPTPILHFLDDTDPVVNQPRYIYEDVDALDYSQMMDTMVESDSITALLKYHLDKNLYSVGDVAKNSMLVECKKFTDSVLEYLDRRPEIKSDVEKRFRSINKQLDQEHILDILSRPDRVLTLKAEAKPRASRTIFSTERPIDLSDFKADSDLIVKSNIPITDSTGKTTFAHVILVKSSAYDAAEEVVFAPKLLTKVEGLDAEGLELWYKNVQLNANVAKVKNIGYSHGDILLEEKITALDESLIELGWISEAELAEIPSVGVLKSNGFFDTLNANNSIIGGYEFYKCIFGDEVSYCADPFKQMGYNLRYSTSTRHLDSMSYIGAVMNEYSSINSTLFEPFKNNPAALFKLCKNNPDIGFYYPQASSVNNAFFSDMTESGIFIKELKIIDVHSIEVAQELGAYILPRTIGNQLMKNVNTFQLPPFAKFCKELSDIYKVAYLGSVGFLIRNFIDSNYKTHIALNDTVSIPAQVKHLFSTMKVLRNYTDIGKEFMTIMRRDFKTDLEYKVFYTVCKEIDLGKDTIIKTVIDGLSEKSAKRATTLVEQLLKETDVTVFKGLQSKLIEPDLFSIIHVFDNYGPSTGLLKSVTRGVVNPSASQKLSTLQSVNKLFTDKLPTRYIYSTNEFIESSARLSMFLQDLERGSTVDQATRNIIKTHFDYSDKSLAMLYTEIVFPFMSFSYKNLEFWVDSIVKNPMLMGELENIFRSVLNYNSLFQPNQEAYKAYDYTFDWSKDVTSFQANAPWTMINAARLYHILNGNIVIDMNKTVKHDSGYGAKDTDLYTVFKLSPSFLDAVKMLYNPIDAYSERLLPPYETVLNIFKGMKEGNVVEQMNVATLANMLPYVDVVMQRAGIGADGLKHNNIIQRVEDGGPLQLLPSVFGMAYVPHKDKMYYYDSDYNILGGFKQNYYGKRYYNTNPYSTKNPQYVYTRLARSKRRAKPIYSPSIKRSAYSQQYNSIVRGTTDRILRYRIRDYHRYY